MQAKSKVTPLLDREGRHWQQHGRPIFPLDGIGRPIESALNTQSQYSKTLVKPIVAIALMEATANITLRLTPADARAHAHAVLKAADMADAVQLEVEARRKA